MKYVLKYVLWVVGGTAVSIIVLCIISMFKLTLSCLNDDCLFVGS